MIHLAGAPDGGFRARPNALVVLENTNDVTPAFHDYLRPLLGSDMPEVARLREVAPEPVIEVDGGVDADTVGGVVGAGASLFVAGSAVFRDPDPAQAYARIAAAAVTLLFHAARLCPRAWVIRFGLNCSHVHAHAPPCNRLGVAKTRSFPIKRPSNAFPLPPTR